MKLKNQIRRLSGILLAALATLVLSGLALFVNKWASLVILVCSVTAFGVYIGLKSGRI